jgi:hypothetical protein
MKKKSQDDAGCCDIWELGMLRANAHCVDLVSHQGVVCDLGIKN